MIHKYFTPVLIALLCMYGGKISAKEISVLSPDGKLTTLYIRVVTCY